TLSGTCRPRGTSPMLSAALRGRAGNVLRAVVLTLFAYYLSEGAALAAPVPPVAAALAVLAVCCVLLGVLSIRSNARGGY
ncbi:MAG TPA: hypothetical protein VFU47_09110, partial [Armatimonadota bacterium]|nr:hypothetical protein [Armatimonadota bacterium]